MGYTRHFMRASWRMALALSLGLALLVTSGGMALAQGGTITYGSSVSGSLTADAPFLIYSFNANAGDMISIVLVGLTPDMQPGANLLGADQRQIAVSGEDPFSGGSGRLARLDHIILQTGAYSLIVNNANNTPGDFLLILDGRPVSLSTTLAQNSPQIVNLPPNVTPVLAGFDALPGGNQTLNISTDTAGFGFLARIYNPAGSLIAGLAGDAVRGVSVTLGPGTGQYVVEIGSATTGIQGTVQIGLGAGGSVLPPTGPQATPTPQAPLATPTSSVCRATGSLNVNVRTGPGTNYPAFGSLTAGASLNVVGRSNDTSWYVVDYNGRQGWVSNSVVLLDGPCSTLPFVTAPPPPATPTPLPTSTPSGPTVDYRSTVADGVTYPPGTCFTFYWTVTNVREVFFDGVGVGGSGQQEKCPAASRSYVLRIVNNDGVIQEFAIPVGITP